MFYNWNQWVGQTVDGKFPLVKNLGCSDHSAAFLTERREGTGVHPATIKLIPAVQESSDEQLSRWRLAAVLSHPRLIRLFESGKCELGGTPLLYVVMEYADENLAGVLPERALTTEETRAMLEAVLEALSYLHGKSFVHGRIRPANILAHGEELKISSDSLCRAGEQHAPSAVDDVWSIGETLVEALTQRPPVQQDVGPAPPLVPLAMPEPFHDIAAHCLLKDPSSRWTLAEISDRLKGRGPAPPVRTLAPPVRTPVQPAEPVIHTQETDLEETDSKEHSYGAYIAAGLALAAILGGPWLFLRRHPQAPPVPVAAVHKAEIQPQVKTQTSPEPRPAQAAPVQDPPKEKAKSFASASPLPAASGSKPPNLEGAKAEVAPPARLSVAGEVVNKVLPDVPRTARKTIRGTIRVTVRVDVDHAGRVEEVELEAPGPSKYFAQLALDAAQRWQFRPPKVAGQDALSTWALRFEFTRAETTASPKQEIP